MILLVELVSQSAFGAAGRIEKPLVLVSNPPPVQMLVPGFTVRELPLQLNNINNLVFAPDGRLFALCYDGNVLQLKDTDSDGLEDKATHFFDNKNNDIPPSIGMCWGPGGLYLPMRGKVIRLTDLGNGTSKMETVASGWVAPAIKAGSDLEALGIAVAKDGTIYFGLGCDAWIAAYRVNKETGKSEYNVRSERGTIQKISPDWKKRETICTGLRFTVSLAINAQGDLFATDQEGATWLPNGNPFDELLHIQSGRHYGFPPRHPKYLPAVVDEPSTFDYGPQHQSTCGLHFNEPVGRGKKIFGPDWWRGDAIVCGESRGKIWRTKLVKTAAGYVAQNNLIACLSMLTVDAVPTPQGDLLVACHSGAPDWGTGPQGKGRLFKISYTDKTAPQPVLAYVPSSTTAKVIFDRRLKSQNFSSFAKASSVSVGRYVTAGERFETIRPGYQVVKLQRTMPRFELDVGEAYFGHDRRSVVLRTSPQTEAVNTAITLPAPLAVDAQAEMTGAEAVWQDASGKIVWAGWLPHLDLTVARAFTAASAEHGELFRLMKRKGMLTLKAQLDLWQMLHPAVQPESKLDFEYPPESVSVDFVGTTKLDIKSSAVRQLPDADFRKARFTLTPKQNEWLPVEISFATGNPESSLEVNWRVAREQFLSRPLPLHRIFQPWVKPHRPVSMTMKISEIEGGDWERGRKIFFGEQAACSKCHQIAGEGGTIGPNLSNLIYRDYASVMKDITEPSAAINPDHIAYNVQLKDGGIENGVVIENTREKIILGQAGGQNLTLSKTNVTDLKASTVSLMPEGLLKGLDAQAQKDLLTFLLTLPSPSHN